MHQNGSELANTGGFATLHVHDKYFGGFAINTKSGFASNEKAEVHILDTILVYLIIFYKMDALMKIKYFKLENSWP